MLPRKYRKDKVRKKVPKHIRKWVFTQDGQACVYCGCNEDLSLDHIAPVGTYLDILPIWIINRGFNMVSACKACNGNRVDKAVLKYGRFLHKPVMLKTYRKAVVRDLVAMTYA